MKLLHCIKCKDIFNLPNNCVERSCSCGLTKGAYITDEKAVYKGKYAVPLGFVNNEFAKAVATSLAPSGMTMVGSLEFKAFVIPSSSANFVRVE
jgi:predicted  nucleic acid-binding Zn-ribbon protein